ncbi:MAG: hypothetical protein HKN78_09400 [Sphingomonadaceae bacterium]|nr:hypothetical protein [Sphingomonadaceae bacterium]
MKPIYAAFALTACLMTAGCTEQAGDGGAEESAAGNRAEASHDAPAEEALSIVLTVDGLRLSDDSNMVTFGTPEETAIAEMDAIAGAPTERSSNDECGAGPMAFAHFGALTINFQNSRLVGWSMFDGEEWEGRPVATPAGITIGSRRAEVEAAPQAVFEETSIGLEFTADGVDGVMSEDGPEGVVINLWAGTNCIFR